ncbi:MAG: hypothetical protein OSJ21_08140, partial [Paramuribaculum intestinale]|nr:hypothetical protein [Paramuribaculum intestinale]
SCLVELCEWMGRNPSLGNPFERCSRREFNATMNYNARYTDIMLFTEPTCRSALAETPDLPAVKAV